MKVTEILRFSFISSFSYIFSLFRFVLSEFPIYATCIEDCKLYNMTS